MTSTQLSTAIKAVKARLAGTTRGTKREVYDPSTGCMTLEWQHLPVSIPYNSLPRVTAKGLAWATAQGLSFYVRTRDIPNHWISESDNPDRQTAKRLPHIITRVMNHELIQRLTALAQDWRDERHEAQEEDEWEEEEYREPSTEQYSSMWEYGEFHGKTQLDEDDAQIFEALFGCAATIEDEEGTRLLRLGDEYQIYVTDKGLDDLDLLFGEEPKDPRHDAREDEWARTQSDSRYGRYDQLENEGVTFTPFQPRLCATKDFNELLKRAHFRVDLFPWPSQQVSQTEVPESIPAFRPFLYVTSKRNNELRKRHEQNWSPFQPIKHQLDAESNPPKPIQATELVRSERGYIAVPLRRKRRSQDSGTCPTAKRKYWPKVKLKEQTHEGPYRITHFRSSGQHSFTTNDVEAWIIPGEPK